MQQDRGPAGSQHGSDHQPHLKPPANAPVTAVEDGQRAAGQAARRRGREDHHTERDGDRARTTRTEGVCGDDLEEEAARGLSQLRGSPLRPVR
jgi:hypothetical protein